MTNIKVSGMVSEVTLMGLNKPTMKSWHTRRERMLLLPNLIDRERLTLLLKNLPDKPKRS
jgi:hypothetical protein